MPSDESKSEKDIREDPEQIARTNSAIAIALGSLVVQVLALWLACEGAGGSHGSYALVKLLFPWPLILVAIGGPLVLPAAVLVVFQFPLYGAIIAWYRFEGSAELPATLILILHAVGAALALAVFRAMP